MSAITLESLGLTKTEILDRVVDRIVEQTMESVAINEDGDADASPTPFARAIKKRVQARIDKAVEDIAAANVLPNIASYVETLCLQETNRWGEKQGKPVTFVEYLVHQAERYLREEVDYQGKAKGPDSYSWRAHGTRVAHLIHEHLQHSIGVAMEQALKTANATIVGGIQDAVKMKLGELLASLKVETKIRA